MTRTLISALQVQRPDARRSAALDMFVLRELARLVRRMKGLRSDLVAIADEFGAQLFEELDYETEAANCRRFGQLYGGVPGILVPSVDERLTTPRVLVQEWVDGEKGPWAEGGDAMLAIGLQCSVLQVLSTRASRAPTLRGRS